MAIVGAGNVGTVLGRLLREGGGSVTAVVSRHAATARKAAAFIRCRVHGDSLTLIGRETDIIFLAVPHAAVADVAAELAATREDLPLPRIAVCHASGMLSADVLAPAARRGAVTFSFHPLQTFPRSFPPKVILPTARGIYFGVDGSAAGIRKARLFAHALGGRTVLIAPERRVLYHAACVIASNHLTGLLAALEEVHAAVTGGSGPSLDPYGPILGATLANILASSPADALSGPVARGGVETVARHIGAVRQYCPGLLPYFACMTGETIRLAARSGSLTPERRAALEDLVRTITDSTHNTGQAQ